MLTKAILTGGVLSALAGCIVYFGTANADALAGEKNNNTRIEETELAGGPQLAGAAEANSSTGSVKKRVKKKHSVAEGSDYKADREVADVEVQDAKMAAADDPIEAKEMATQEKPAPKTKWLDQYLKKTKPEAKNSWDDKPEKEDTSMVAEDSSMAASDTEEDSSMASDMMKTFEMKKAEMDKADVMNSDAMDSAVMDSDVTDSDVTDSGPMEAEIEVLEVETETQTEVMEDKADAMHEPHAEKKMRKRMWRKKHIEDAETDANGERHKFWAKKRMKKDDMMKDHATVTGEVDIDIDAIDLDALDLEGDIDVDVIKKQLGLDGKENVEIRVIKKMIGKPSHSEKRHTQRAINQGPAIDYDMVLAEAQKLLVVDMRNQAVLEIIDYAVDNLDMSEAADLVVELSTPELRDTARARIGAGLARCGKSEAAFAVINELEIDELAAPIRLEIITALMATTQERKAAGFRN